MDAPSEKTGVPDVRFTQGAFRAEPDKMPFLLDKTGSFLYYLAACWLFSAFTVFALLLLASPLLIQSENKTLLGLGALAYNMVSAFSMCHQLPMRSFFIKGVQQAVCARDIGIYLGLIAGTVFFIRKGAGSYGSKRFFLLTLLPLALDGVTQTILHLRESNNLLRVTTGLAFGFGLCLFILARIKRLNAPAFRETTSNRFFLTALAILAAVSAILLLKLGYAAGGLYITKQQAVEAAYGPDTPRLEAFYIPPRTPLSLYFLPPAGENPDNVIQDLSGMKWVGEAINSIINGSLLLNQNVSLELIPAGHTHGIWAVVQAGGACALPDSMTVYCGAQGEYRYVDASTGEVFDARQH
jgi:uncharacterized membrane protein